MGGNALGGLRRAWGWLIGLVGVVNGWVLLVGWPGVGSALWRMEGRCRGDGRGGSGVENKTGGIWML